MGGAESIAPINHPPDQPWAASRLTEPQGLDDLLPYRLCAGVHGITRREWRLVALQGLAATLPRIGRQHGKGRLPA